MRRSRQWSGTTNHGEDQQQRTHSPGAQDESLGAALLAHRGATHQRFGEIGDEDGGQERNAAATFPESDAEHEIFRDSHKMCGCRRPQ